MEKEYYQVRLNESCQTYLTIIKWCVKNIENDWCSDSNTKEEWINWYEHNREFIFNIHASYTNTFLFENKDDALKFKLTWT